MDESRIRRRRGTKEKVTKKLPGDRGNGDVITCSKGERYSGTYTIIHLAAKGPQNTKHSIKKQEKEKENTTGGIKKSTTGLK